MMIQGKSCTLTVAKDGYYYPLPYSEKTVRTASKGYALPGVIGIRNREKLVETGKAITGCVVTRLEYNNILALFLLLFYREEKFDQLADRVAYKVIYKNLSIKEFELRGENKAPLYLRLDVQENDDSYTSSWDINTPSLKWTPNRTFYFDGHNVIADLKVLPLVYRFELTGKYTEKAKYSITLYFPFTDDYFPTQNNIEKLTIVLDVKFGASLDLYDLKPINDMGDINCADTEVCFQKFEVCGIVVFNIRNQEQNTTVVL
ncbi:MAG: hypothetical protein UHO11_05555 [Treponema sp.]|nr:hypothetical protein [Treponema sp.]